VAGRDGRLGPQLLMPGRPVGAGAAPPGDGLALDVTRLAALAPALQRRLLRYAAEQLGAALDFPSTEALRALALTGPRRAEALELAQGLRAERTQRELRLAVGLPAEPARRCGGGCSRVQRAIPGEIVAPAFGLRLRIEVRDPLRGPGRPPTLRNWKPGDRVRLRYSSGPRKVKEVLERLRVTGSSRAFGRCSR
jgi:tRNA(Ile)-lysidine synthase